MNISQIANFSCFVSTRSHTCEPVVSNQFLWIGELVYRCGANFSGSVKREKFNKTMKDQKKVSRCLKNHGNRDNDLYDTLHTQADFQVSFWYFNNCWDYFFSLKLKKKIFFAVNQKYIIWIVLASLIKILTKTVNNSRSSLISPRDSPSDSGRGHLILQCSRLNI